MTYYIATRQQANLSTDSIFVYEREGDSLTLVSSRAVPDIANSPQAVGTARFSPDNSRVLVAHAGSVFQAPSVTLFDVESDGSLTYLSALDRGTSGRDVTWLSKTRAVVGQRDNGPDDSLIDLLGISEDGTLTVLDSALPTGSANSALFVVATGTGKLVTQDNAQLMQLWSVEGDTLTELASLDIGILSGDESRSGHRTEDWVAVHSGDQLRVYDFSADTISLAASVTLSGDAGGVAWYGQNQLMTDEEKYSFDGSSLSLIEETGANSNKPVAAEWAGTHFAVLSFTGEVELYTQDGIVNVDTTPDINALNLSVSNTALAPTPEQQFNLTYADVSGRDPLATALTQRTPAKQLVNYLVSLYAGTNPRIVSKPVHIEAGELDKTSPAPASGDLSRQIWIEDDRDPNFKGGRWATILGRSGGADPGTVELTLFIADNPESFVEPT